MDKARRSRREHLSAIALASWLSGCPYDATIEPARTPVALSSYLVGTWVCSAPNEPDWADLSVGWTSGPAYLLTLRPRQPDPSDDDPAVFRGTPRLVGGTELWTLSDDQVTGETPQFIFARLTRRGARHVQWTLLGGDEGDSKGHLDITSPEDLSLLLSDPTKAVADAVMECR